MKISRSVVALAVAASLSLAACASSDADGDDPGGTDGPQEDQELVEFTLGSFNGEIYVLDYVADQQGFFEDNGLEATFISPQSGGASANTLFLGGTLSGWPGNPAPLMVNLTKGEDIKIAGWLDNWIPFGIVVPGDSDLAELVDAPFEEKMQALEGRQIGLTAIGSLVYQSLLAGLDSAGMAESDVTILAVGQPDAGIGQMESGRIDAYVTYSRTDVAVFADRTDAVLFAELTGPEAPEEIRAYSSFALPVMASLVEEDPDVVEGYVAAQKQAYDWTRDNIDEAAQMVADQVYNGDYVDAITDALNELYANDQPYEDLRVNPESWNNLANLIAHLGMIEESDLDKLEYDDVVLDFAKVD